MSRQNSSEVSSLEVTLRGSQVNIDPVANATKPFDDVKVLLLKGEAGRVEVADKVAHKLKLGSATTIDFDGSVAGGVDMWNLVCPLTASGWSALTDADGFYTQDIYPTYNGNTAYFDMDKPVIITIASAPNNQRPTSAEQAAYNMIDPNWYYPDSGTPYFRFYTKTKPTTDFYVRIMGFSVYNTI